MEINKVEVAIISETVESSKEVGKEQLAALELLMVGGGCGDILFQ